MAGATSNDTARAVAETRRMCRLGVDYILTATPYYNKPTQGGLFRHFTAVADASTKPICLYNVPGRTAVNLQPATALHLAEHPNVMGIKEASGDLAQVMQILRAPARAASPCCRATTGSRWRSSRRAATVSSPSPRTRCRARCAAMVHLDARGRRPEGDGSGTTGCCR